jgi:sec-independent protein translocase protein TatA
MHILVAAIGMMELVIFGGVVLLLFGATKIPQLMRGLGQGVHEFKKGIQDGLPDEKKKENEPK